MSEDRLPGYNKILPLGHRFLGDLLEEDVIIQEKLDGSQISFGCIDGKLMIRSKGKMIDNLEDVDKLFKSAVINIVALKDRLLPDCIYRGEVLRAKRHNHLEYDRHPHGHIAVFDMVNYDGTYISLLNENIIFHIDKTLGFEVVQHIDNKDGKTIEEIVDNHPSMLGGSMEGVVVKRYMDDGKTLIAGKFVGEKFREVQSDLKERKSKRRTSKDKDIVSDVIKPYCTEARWNKAVQHLKESGEIGGIPEDIGKLFKEVNQDVLAECEDEIKESLFKAAWPVMSKRLTKGLAEWYKEKLNG